MIKRLAERDLETKFGTFREVLYYDGQKESIALIMGNVRGGENILCRAHFHCIGAHVFNSVECTCREEMAAAQSAIPEAARGVIIWLDQEGKGNGHLALLESIPFKQELGQAEAYIRAGYKRDGRDYTAAAQILTDREVRSVALLTNDVAKADALRAVGVTVDSIIPVSIAAPQKAP